MKVTKARIILPESNRDSKLLAYASIILDHEFVVYDLKLIQGKDSIFVAMPSRKEHYPCVHCKSNNHLRANYCNHCGSALNNKLWECFRCRGTGGWEDEEGFRECLSCRGTGREIIYFDIAHPISSSCRWDIHQAVSKAYEQRKSSGTFWEK